MGEELLQCTELERNQILSVFNRTSETIKEDIAILKKWKLSQPHLPEMPTDFMIEKFLIVNKMSIEKTKHSLDYYYSIKNRFPDMFTTRIPNFSCKNIMYYFPLPKLHKNCRLTYLKFRELDTRLFHPMDIFRTMASYGELRLERDYSLAEISVSDMTGMTLGHATRFQPSQLRIMSFLSENVFRHNIRELHILNAPQYFEAVITFLKGYFPEKLANRVRLHPNLDSLLEYIPKDCLPKDFGGEQKSIDELQNLWHKEIKNFLPRFIELDKLIVNETLRPEKLENHEILGFHGNFRKLNID